MGTILFGFPHTPLVEHTYIPIQMGCEESQKEEFWQEIDKVKKLTSCLLYQELNIL